MITSSKPIEDYSLNKSDYLILCFYMNTTSKYQVIRIKNIPKFFLEKVISPGEHCVFEAFSECLLEISTYQALRAEVMSNK